MDSVSVAEMTVCYETVIKIIIGSAVITMEALSRGTTVMEAPEQRSSRKVGFTGAGIATK